MKIRSYLPGLAALAAMGPYAGAGPLKEARIDQIVNEVKVIEPEKGAHLAKLQETIKDDLGVATGAQSRAQLLFQDNTLTRLGPETFFSFEPGTRNLNLKGGSMLLQVPKNIGGAEIRAASVSASITGTTIMMEHLPGKAVKIVVLEGSLKVGIDERPGQSVILRPGKMVTLSPQAKELPAPVNVDLRKVVRTSALINPALFKGKTGARVAALPSMGLIETESVRQEKSPMTGPVASPGIDVPVATTSQPAPLLPDTTLAATETTSDAVKVTAVTAGPAPTGPSSAKSKGDNDRSDAGPTNGGQNQAPQDPFATMPMPAIPNAPSSTWRFSTPPLAFPDMSATAGTGSGSPKDKPPTVIGGTKGSADYVFGPSTQISMGGGAPQIKTTGSKAGGAIYGGAAVDGAASTFLFGSSNATDAQLHFDDRFGLTGGPGSMPPTAVAVYKFAGLQVTSAPKISTAPGRSDLALISQGAINSAAGGVGVNWDVSDLHSLTIATESGGMTLGMNISAAAPSGPTHDDSAEGGKGNGAPSNFQWLELYGRAGDVTLTGNVQLPGGAVSMDAAGNANLASTGSITAQDVVMNGIGSIQIGGAETASFAQLWSNGTIAVNGAVNAETLYAKGNSINLGLGGSIHGANLSLTTASDFGPGATGTVVAATNELIIQAGGKFFLNTTNPAGTVFDLSKTRSLRVAADTLTIPNSVAMAPGTTGILKAGGGGLNATGFNLSKFQLIAGTSGAIAANNLDATYLTTASADVNLTGNLSVDEAAAGGNLNVTGTIGARGGEAADARHYITASQVEAGGGLDFQGTNMSLGGARPTDGGELVLTSTKGDIVFGNGPAAIGGANFNGGDAAALSTQGGGNGGFLSVGTEAKPTAGKIVVNTPVSASTGANGTGAPRGGKGGTVQMVAKDTITVNAKIQVSSSAPGHASKQGGNIRIESRKSNGTAINISNSGEVLSLLAAAAPGPGGTVQVLSAGGDIIVNGGVVQADKGSVLVRNTGAGNISLTNANIRGDTVKIGAFGPNGQLIIGGGTINADTSLQLYAGSSNGQVVFTNNVTLGGAGTKIIAGKTVTIDNGKTVTIGGRSPANVYTDNANYSGSGGNSSTSGKFGGRGATTQGFAGRPAF